MYVYFESEYYENFLNIVVNNLKNKPYIVVDKIFGFSKIINRKIHYTDLGKNIDKTFNYYLDSYLINAYDFMGFICHNKINIFKPFGIIITRLVPERNKNNHCNKYIWMFTNSEHINYLDLPQFKINNKRMLKFINI